jgi:hypothetical protein
MKIKKRDSTNRQGKHMTFYDVHISSANLSGSASTMRNLIAAMDVFEESITDGRWKNVPYCSECKLSGMYEGGPNSLYHTFRVREDVALKIIESAEFKWRTIKGLNRVPPKEWLAKQVAAGTEMWFTVEFFEL